MHIHMESDAVYFILGYEGQANTSKKIYSCKWKCHETVPWKREEEQEWKWVDIIFQIML